MKKISKYLEVAKEMPPLYHTLPGEKFDIRKSEVVKWLLEQPEIMNYIVNRIKGGKEQSPFITYDPSTGKWKGVNYEN